MPLSLRLCVCLLVAGAVSGEERVSPVSRLGEFARAVADSPRLGEAVEQALSRALGVPRPRLAGVGKAVQGLFGLPLISLGTIVTAAVPGIAVLALIISIIALIKTTFLFKSTLYPSDTLIGAYGTAGRDYAHGEEYHGYGHYDETEYVHHAPGPIEYGRSSEHSQHGTGAAVSDYARARAEDGDKTGREGRRDSKADSATATKDGKRDEAAKSGKVLWS